MIKSHIGILMVGLLMIGCISKSAETTTQKVTGSKLSNEYEADSTRHVSLEGTKVDVIVSKYTQQSYDVYVSYPHNYASSKKYPVLIVLDAEVNFGAVSYITSRLEKDSLIEQLLVVGVAYTGETSEDSYYSIRCRDFTPTADSGYMNAHKNFTSGSGGADDFLKFLKHELFPHLKKNYVIADDRHGIYGHSFGGLFGTYVMLNEPDLFDRYLLLSPSLWWDRKVIIKSLQTPSLKIETPSSLYLATGQLEREMVIDHREFISVYQQKIRDTNKLKSEILDNETHRTVFGRGLTDGLRFLYGGEKFHHD